MAAKRGRAPPRAPQRAPPRAPDADVITGRAAGKRGAAGGRAAVDAFAPERFEPYGTSSGHGQTIASHLFPRAPPLGRVARVELPTADAADTLHLDVAGGAALAPADDPGAPRDVALVVHGLESNSAGGNSVRIAAALLARGFKVVLHNARSCSDAAPLPASAVAYHAGFYDDLVTVIRALRGARVYLVGFSLGANKIANLLGRVPRAQVLDLGIVCAAGMSVPFDPRSSQAKIDSGFSRVVYARRLAGSIAAKVKAAADAGVEYPPNMSVARAAAARTIGEIDDAYVAPVYGFADRFDYYSQVDPRQFLSRIPVPAYFLNARDDPFFDHENDARGDPSLSLPTQDDLGDAPVKIYIAPHGGHCGFLDADGARGVRPMYGPRELARFCAHVRDELAQGNVELGPSDDHADDAGGAWTGSRRTRPRVSDKAVHNRPLADGE